jgi:hypothetical protein
MCFLRTEMAEKVMSNDLYRHMSVCNAGPGGCAV